MHSTLDFPYLSEDGESSSAVPSANLNSLTLQSFNRNSVPQRPKSAMSYDEFPALVKTTSGPEVTVSVTSGSIYNQSRLNLSIHRQNNMPSGASNVSIHLAPKNSQQNNKEKENKKPTQPSWSKKNRAFEDEFPELKTKKPSVSFTNAVNATVVNNVERKAQQASVEIVPDLQGGSDQFVIIKSKSRVNKENKEAFNENTDVSNQKDDATSSLLNNNNFYLLGQVSDNEFSKLLVRPCDNTQKNYIEDNWIKPASFDKDDFPPLASSEPIRKPPGFNGPGRKPPPGFSISSSSPKNSAPLNISLSSIARQISAPKQVETKLPHSDEKYKKPPQFNTRNERLSHKIQELSILEPFQIPSRRFRQDLITAADYHSKCLELLHEKDFVHIFPELIALLPDINKQQELLDVHRKYQNDSGAVPKQAFSDALSVCDICYQVLKAADYEYHLSQHQSEVRE